MYYIYIHIYTYKYILVYRFYIYSNRYLYIFVYTYLQVCVYINKYMYIYIERGISLNSYLRLKRSKQILKMFSIRIECNRAKYLVPIPQLLLCLLSPPASNPCHPMVSTKAAPCVLAGH